MDGGAAVARRVSHAMTRMTNQKFSCIRMNIRNCSRSRSSSTNRRSTTRERPGSLRPSPKQPPEEEAAHRLDRAERRQITW
jgi:hypothetical protein